MNEQNIAAGTKALMDAFSLDEHEASTIANFVALAKTYNLSKENTQRRQIVLGELLQNIYLTKHGINLESL